MTKTLLLAVLLFPLVALAQKKTEQKITLPIDSVTNLITYQEVVQAPGLTKDELYIRAKEWFAKTFRSANDVIQMDDKESGKIIGKGASKSMYSFVTVIVEYNLHYTIAITVKEGRYRYEISSLYAKSDGGLNTDIEKSYQIYTTKGSGYAVHKKIIPFVDSNSKRLIESIKAALSQPAKSDKSKDEF